jgi:dipeptidyl aminopeptidase/acylaminoacyl peptidase
MQLMPNKIVFLCLFLFSGTLYAQKPNFAAADKYDAPKLEKKMGTTSVIPFFFKNSNRFWFIQQSPVIEAKPLPAENSPNFKDSVYTFFEPDAKTTEFYLVDPQRGQKTALFDKKAVEAGIGALSSSNFDAKKILYAPSFDDEGKNVTVSYGNLRYDYNLLNKKVSLHHELQDKKITVYQTGDKSPDHNWILYSINHNLYLRRIADTTGTQLSKDGTLNHSFSMNPGHEFLNSIIGTNARWTSDSKCFYVLRADTRKVKTMTVINSLASPRPYVNTYTYELPGDKEVTQYELFIGDNTSMRIKKVDINKWPDQEVFTVTSSDDNQEMFFIRKKRSRDEMELCAVELQTGIVRVVIHEVSKPFINEDLFNVSIVNSGKDIIWWSDRTGWGQYYHYNGSGKFLNAVTKGEWTAAKIIGIDTLRRQLYLYGYGHEKGINPNYAFVYKTNFKGTAEQLLTPENATHSIFLSKDRKYFVDNFSRIDLEPRTIVRNTKGDLSLEVMKTDFSKLYAYGWKQSEPFTVKAKDGVTDLYGLMWKPFDFDPSKKYPIISQVYPGPQIETVWSEFTVLDRYNNTSLAQTGFIVVVMGHRGGTPIRNAAYYKFGHGNLRDYALEDDKHGLEQLGERFNFIDLNRVGVFGHSGGGMMSAAALCTYPDFYKVAVSSSANHDNTIYNRTWGETYQGPAPMPLNQSLAKNLKGHLLMVTGESDANVNPAGTMRMADALIKADKDFDLLVLPGQGHTYEGPYKGYFQHRLRAYFAKYLLNKE